MLLPSGFALGHPCLAFPDSRGPLGSPLQQWVWRLWNWPQGPSACAELCGDRVASCCYLPSSWAGIGSFLAPVFCDYGFNPHAENWLRRKPQTNLMLRIERKKKQRNDRPQPGHGCTGWIPFLIRIPGGSFRLTGRVLPSWWTAPSALLSVIPGDICKGLKLRIWQDRLPRKDVVTMVLRRQLSERDVSLPRPPDRNTNTKQSGLLSLQKSRTCCMLVKCKVSC